jgi:ATP-dependent DNA helicase RecG
MPTSLAEFERWLNAPREDEHLEFKEAKISYDFQKVLNYCVALANEGGGKLVLGVTDARPRRVVNTAAFLDVQDVREGIWNALRRRIDVEELTHPDGRVVIFHVPARPRGEPLHRDGRYLMRVGEQLLPMSPERLQQIFAEVEPDFTAGVVPGIGLDALDPIAVENFRTVWATRSGNSAIRALPLEQLLVDAELIVDGAITRAALVLLSSEAAMRRHLAAAEVIFEYRSSDGSLPYQQRIEFRRGFFAWYEELWERINLRNDRQMVLDGLFRVEIPTFDEGAVREALLNAVSHRDYQRPGSVFIRQYPRRLEIVSPGGFPLGITPENILDRQEPRNRRIAEAFARCRLVERSGQGMDRIFERLIRNSQPRPDFSGTDAYQVSLTLHGEVGNPAFVRFLEKLGAERLESFSTRDYLVLDHVQRDEAVPDTLRMNLARLLDAGAIERVGRKLLLSRALYAHLGQRGTYTRKRGLDHDTNKAFLLKHIREHARDGSPLADLVQVLPHVGPRKVQQLLAELRREGAVHPRGQRRWARWHVGADPSAAPDRDAAPSRAVDPAL